MHGQIWAVRMDISKEDFEEGDYGQWNPGGHKDDNPSLPRRS